MPQIDFIAYSTGGGANVDTQAAFLARANNLGAQPDTVALSAWANKLWRQSSFIGAGVANFVSQTLNTDVLDDGNLNGFVTSLTAAIAAKAPVQSFNGRTGAVVLSGTDVRTALGYTPANKAGDTFTGGVNFSNGINITSGGGACVDGFTTDGLTVSAGAAVGGGLAVTGGQTVAGGLHVTSGATTLDAGVHVTAGNALFDSGIHVTAGNATFDGAVNANGALNANSGLAVTGGATVAGGLAVGGGLSVNSGLTTLAAGLTVSGGALTLPNGSVTNAFLANMAAATIKGRAAGAGAGVPTDLNAATILALIGIIGGAGYYEIPYNNGGALETLTVEMGTTSAMSPGDNTTFNLAHAFTTYVKGFVTTNGSGAAADNCVAQLVGVTVGTPCQIQIKMQNVAAAGVNPQTANYIVFGKK